MTFTEFQACLYFLIDTLPSETTNTVFWECQLLENSEYLFKVLIQLRRH